MPSIPKDIKEIVTNNPKPGLTGGNQAPTGPALSSTPNPFGDFFSQLMSNPDSMEALSAIFNGIMTGGGGDGFDPNNPVFRGTVDQGFGNNNFSFKCGGKLKKFPFGGYTPTLYNQARPIRSFDTNFAKGFPGEGGQMMSGFDAGNMNPSNIPPMFTGRQDAPVNTGIPNSPLAEYMRLGDTVRRQYLPFFAEDGGYPFKAPTSAYPEKYEDLEFQPVQAEPKEKAILPDYSIVDTKSKKLHKDMKKEEVTDIFPEDTYIISDKIMIKKKDVEQVSYGFLPAFYDENNYDDSPLKEMKFTDVMPRDEMSAFDIVKEIQKMYPVSDRYRDPIAKKTNDENKMHRSIYLETLKRFSERERLKKFPNSKREYNPQAAEFGGPVKYQGGGDVDGGLTADAIGQVTQGIGGLFNFINGFFERSRAKKDQAFREKLFDEAYGQQQSNLQLGTLSGLASIFAQDPTIEAPDRSRQLQTLRNRYDRIPQNIIDSFVSRSRGANNQALDYIFRNSGNTSRALARASSIIGQTEQGIQTGLRDFALRDVELKNNNLLDESNLLGIIAQDEANARNSTRTNRNRQIGTAGTLGTNYYNNLNNLLADRVSQTLVSQGLGSAQLNQANQGIAQSVLDLGTILSGFTFLGPGNSGNLGANNQASNPYGNSVTPGISNRIIF